MAQQSIEVSVVSPKQRALLKEVGRFRFVTADLLAVHLHLASFSAMRRRLGRLVDSGYLGRHFVPTDRLQQSPAFYYLTPKSRALLRHDMPETVLDGIYKHEKASKRLQRHCVAVLQVMVQLEQRMGASVACYPKNDLAIYDYLPQPLPDGLIITTLDDRQRHHYLLEVLDPAMPRFAIRDRLRYYRDYIEAGAWTVTGLPTPTILVVCRSDVQRQFIERVIDSLILGEPPSVRFELSIVS